MTPSTAAVVKALQARGHFILATQIRLAARYPQSKVTREIVAENAKRAADKGTEGDR